MKKLILGIVMIGLIVAVSYLRTERSDHRIQKITSQVTERLQSQISQLQASIDSVESTHIISTEKLSDSVAAIVQTKQLSIDSLTKLVKSQNASMKLAQKKKEELGKKDDLHRRILTYYKKRYKQLPSDLTNYERRVALKEIRQETADQFSVSLKQLSSIRKESQLPY